MKNNIGLQGLIVIVSVVLLAGKFAAYLLTHSNAILTDALESIVNVAAALMGLFSIKLSAKPRDRDHPYGHGKIEFISAAVEGSLILFAGALIIGKSVYNSFHPHRLESVDLGLLLVSATGIINLILGLIAERQGKNSSSPALLSSGKHLQSDAYSTFGIAVGLLLILVLKTQWLDNAVAIFFGAWIMITGWRVVRSAVAGIMDEADYALLKKIISHLNAHRRPSWVDLHNMRVIKYGNVLHVDCHVTVPYYLTVQEAHREVEALNSTVAKTVNNPLELFIHTDACVPPRQCSLCIREDCPVRQAAFEGRIEWTLDTSLRNVKHGW